MANHLLSLAVILLAFAAPLPSAAGEAKGTLTVQVRVVRHAEARVTAEGLVTLPTAVGARPLQTISDGRLTVNL